MGPEVAVTVAVSTGPGSRSCALRVTSDRYGWRITSVLPRSQRWHTVWALGGRATTVVDDGARVEAAQRVSEAREPFAARRWDMSCCDESVVICGASAVRGPAGVWLLWVIPQTRSKAAAAANTNSTACAATWRKRGPVRARVIGEALYLGAAWKIVAVM